MTIVLKNEHLTVKFKKLGGALSSIVDNDGVEYLWQGDPTYWSSQAPVLFPICGSLRNDSACYRSDESEGTNRMIPRHGLVRKKQFELVSSSKNQVCFTLHNDDNMLENYPYRFELSIVYTLESHSIHIEYIVKNLEQEKVLPYYIGGHPGFNCPLLSNENYDDYYLEFKKEETCSIPKQFPDTGLLDCLDRTPFLKNQKILNLDYHLFEKDAITLDELASREVTLRSRIHDKGVKLYFEDFPYLVIWSTTNQSPFIAIEPWSGLSTSLEESDYFDEKRGVTFVEPKQVSTKRYTIQILSEPF